MGPPTPGQSSRLDLLQKMHRGSTSGVQILSELQGGGPTHQGSSQTTPEEDMSMNVVDSDGENESPIVCMGCQATSTPGTFSPPSVLYQPFKPTTTEWRRGPMGPVRPFLSLMMVACQLISKQRTLCNACGLVWAKMVKKRKSQGQKPHDEEDELASSDEESDPLAHNPV